MKTNTRVLIAVAVLLGLAQSSVIGQKFKSTAEAKSYFYNIDDTFNLAMVTKDSTVLRLSFLLIL